LLSACCKAKKFHLAKELIENTILPNSHLFLPDIVLCNSMLRIASRFDRQTLHNIIEFMKRENVTFGNAELQHRSWIWMKILFYLTYWLIDLLFDLIWFDLIFDLFDFVRRSTKLWTFDWGLWSIWWYEQSIDTLPRNGTKRIETKSSVRNNPLYFTFSQRQQFFSMDHHWHSTFFLTFSLSLFVWRVFTSLIYAICETTDNEKYEFSFLRHKK
jgi:hypothetical protein